MEPYVPFQAENPESQEPSVAYGDPWGWKGRLDPILFLVIEGITPQNPSRILTDLCSEVVQHSAPANALGPSMAKAIPEPHYSNR